MPNPSIAIIGCGSIGERHLRCFLETGEATVTACDTNQDRLDYLAQRYNVSTLTDWQQTLTADTFDAAVICTPANHHVPMARALLEAGLHVLIEKPLSHSLSHVDDLISTHERSGKEAAVAYVYHQIPVLTSARDYLRHGKLGEILHATVVTGQPFHLLRPAYADTYYRDRGCGGGAIQDALTHLANWMESVVGSADSVFCDHAHQALPGVSVEDTVHVSARHGSTLVSYALNQFQAPNESFIQFDAAAGSLRIELHRNRWGTFRPDDSGWSWQTHPVGGRDVNFRAQAQAFLAQISDRAPRLCSLAEAAQTLRFNQAALASAASGTRIICSDLPSTILNS